MKLFPTSARARVIFGSRVPMFCAGEVRANKLVVYLDHDGGWACCNFQPVVNLRLCCVCGNHCITFVVDDHGEYTCSACGKFPPEILLQ
jgi:hypothetical protein